MKKLIIYFLGLLFLPLISADVIFSMYTFLIPFFPFFLIIEAFAFWFFSKKFLKISVSFWKSFLIVFVANIISLIPGFFLPSNILIFFLAFVLSFFIEFGVYLLFFIKKDVLKRNLFLLSFLVNLTSYLPIFLLSLFGN